MPLRKNFERFKYYIDILEYFKFLGNLDFPDFTLNKVLEQWAQNYAVHRTSAAASSMPLADFRLNFIWLLGAAPMPLN